MFLRIDKLKQITKLKKVIIDMRTNAPIKVPVEIMDELKDTQQSLKEKERCLEEKLSAIECMEAHIKVLKEDNVKKDEEIHALKSKPSGEKIQDMMNQLMQDMKKKTNHWKSRIAELEKQLNDEKAQKKKMKEKLESTEETLQAIKKAIQKHDKGNPSAVIPPAKRPLADVTNESNTTFTPNKKPVEHYTPQVSGIFTSLPRNK
ncbi:hypothetical protein BDB01DRAFT_262117 [Pilobolus umbonatus]|nr:hypothetical protein BDB01DRAFT_262117 [Pilobolus umbonatus]